MVRNLVKRFLSNSSIPQSVAEPLPFLSRDRAATLLERYRSRHIERTGYATVADYCDSVDHVPELTGRQGDLKDVQRPWAFKTILALVPPGGRLLEIGAGKPDVAEALCDCGYKVIAVDPYQGAGNGPTEFTEYRKHFPKVEIRRELFTESLELMPASFDAIYSISTLEHIADLNPIFRGIRKFLKPGNGLSIHCIDVVTRGMDDAYHLQQAAKLLRLHGEPDGAWDQLLTRANEDLETYFLGPSGHQLWRGSTPYEKFPYRKVMSLQTYARTSDLLLPNL